MQAQDALMAGNAWKASTPGYLALVNNAGRKVPRQPKHEFLHIWRKRLIWKQSCASVKLPNYHTKFF